MEPARLIGQIDAAADRLETTVGRFGDEDLFQPALHCPGWSRGHVVTHVARSSEALRNLLVWARTGVETPAYRSQAARDAAIAAGARRGAAEQLADLRDSATAFRTEADRVGRDCWQMRVRVLASSEFPAWQVLVRRLVEIELHHTDLDVGYGPTGWPAEFTTMSLDEPMRSQRRDRISTDARLWGP